MLSRCLGCGEGQGGTESTVQSVPGKNPSLIWKHSLKSNATSALCRLSRAQETPPSDLEPLAYQTTLTPESLMKFDWNQLGIVEFLAAWKGFIVFWVETLRLFLLVESTHVCIPGAAWVDEGTSLLSTTNWSTGRRRPVSYSHLCF